ncbi:Phosphoesterase [Candidatus Desulfarcum epimagneticum]|uniref:Phosphoesterase n=1 Tax=uncultured Desulfobacteraceae bacterium TaxID=218296 RepID=A0A484HFL2_9BACT|nr:Phosphoesterase [uncultured Desulfobacteraceae bacterium]
MKIGVISDTHLSRPNKALANLMRGPFQDVSLALHAGDLTSISVLDAFGDLEVIAVAGNMDAHGTASSLPPSRIVEADGFRIGLTHGWGARQGLEKRIMESFENVDAIVYGHSHVPANHVKNGVLMFNPGAFMGSYSGSLGGSVGILTTGENGVRGEIVPV